MVSGVFVGAALFVLVGVVMAVGVTVASRAMTRRR